MTSVIVLYLAIGFFSYWPLIFSYKINSMGNLDPWYQWMAAWAVWTLIWPYRYIADAWYWWRAKK